MLEIGIWDEAVDVTTSCNRSGFHSSYVPFYLLYGSLICSKRLQSDRCGGMLANPGPPRAKTGRKTTVLERQKNRGCFSSLSFTWLLVRKSWWVITNHIIFTVSCNKRIQVCRVNNKILHWKTKINLILIIKTVMIYWECIMQTKITTPKVSIGFITHLLNVFLRWVGGC